MEIINILKYVKLQLFSPKKKIIFDNFGKKILSEVTPDDKEYLSPELDGWDVADKDFVNEKILELYNKLSNQPSAPFDFSNKSMLLSQGQILDESTLVFFQPGIVLKKNFIIRDFTIVTDVAFDEEITLNMKNITDSKTTLISKIKSMNKKVVLADCKYKVENYRPVVFEIKFSNIKNTNYKINLQITLEI